MAEALLRGNEICAKNLERKQTEQAIEGHTNWKKARVQELEEQKQWIHRQRIQHTYGPDDDDDDDNEDDINGSHQLKETDEMQVWIFHP